MLNYAHFAVTLAQAVELFRTRPNDVPDQKTALRALVALTKLGGATVRSEHDRLVVEGTIVPPTLPAIRSLAERLDELGVGEISIARNASPAELLILLRALSVDRADEPKGSVERRLRESQAESVVVLSAKAEEIGAGQKPMRVTEAFVAAGLLEEEAAGSEEETDDLLQRLIEAGTIEQRLSRFEALRRTEGGEERALGLLEHDDPAVVRETASLMGELRLEGAVAGLGKLLEHGDSDVQRAAAVALARIGGPEATELVGAVLKGDDPALGLAVARSVKETSPGELAAALSSAARSERNLELKCGYYHALGRLGTPEALRALIKEAQPGGRFIGRKPGEVRVAAVEGLALIGGPVALGTLEWLEKDSNKDVRGAVRRALKTLRATGP